MNTVNAGTHIFLVEDQPDVCESLCDLWKLSGQFSHVSACKSAEDLLADPALCHTSLVVLDIGLPGMDGIECLVRIKAIRPELRVLMFTVFEHDDSVFTALKAGADGYLLKRETPERMIAAIVDALDGGAPMSRDIARRVLHSFRETPPLGPSACAGLSDREIAVLELLSKGQLYKEIADRLNISINTVKQHIHHIYAKLQVQNRTEAVLRYLER